VKKLVRKLEKGLTLIELGMAKSLFVFAVCMLRLLDLVQGSHDKQKLSLTITTPQEAHSLSNKLVLNFKHVNVTYIISNAITLCDSM